MNCQVTGCKRKRKLRGMCQRHYQRTKRNGDPTMAKVSPWRLQFGAFANRAT
jgi:hypothetical protein